MKAISIDNCDLVYSSDDDYATGEGYYWQRYPDGATSDLSYETSDQAVKEMTKDNVTFEGGRI